MASEIERMLPKSSTRPVLDRLLKQCCFKVPISLRRHFIGFAPVFCHSGFQRSIYNYTRRVQLSDKCLNTCYCSPEYQGVNIALAFVRLGDEEICDMATNVVLIADRIAAEDLLEDSRIG